MDLGDGFLEGWNLGEDTWCEEAGCVQGLEVVGVGLIEGFVPVLGVDRCEFC